MATSRRTAPRRALLKGSISLETPLGAVLSDSRIRLLEAIHQCGSLNLSLARVVALARFEKCTEFGF